MAAFQTLAKLTCGAAPSTLAAAPQWPPPAAACRRRRCCVGAPLLSAAQLQRSQPLAAPQRQSRRQHMLCAAAGGSDGGGGQEEPAAPVASAAVFLAGGTAANGAMAAVGVALGDRAGLDVSGQLSGILNTLDVPAALAYMLPLLAACYAGVVFADRLEGFGQLRHMFKTALIPQLRILPFWGLGLLALGAGVGEETLFRAFMQEALCSGLADAAPSLPAGVTTAAGVAVASLVFGWLHALTPTYLLFATGAGALFGVEYLIYGLPTAAVTHWIYDWIALAFILREWGGGSNAEEAG